eukprot:gnl/MRDRNA2_/MRDRNA2_44329_c0_seq1.p1 gnl/MRDRNA2_/MRDRNA2_44329_c0~~gnl/MRDRNA2_/MRDRNA2_44329_c0_seq1.p1  ORF type:complete len:217 (-),score=36.79 gnl/MRDRNA2_/MRDRNA2_44329_c0_seq1:32-610(-)
MSALISQIVVLAFSGLYPKGIVYIEGWSEPKVARQLVIWRVKIIALVAFALSYILFCMLFVGLFLASVKDVDKDEFLVASISQLTQQWLVVPVVTTVVIGLAFGFVKKGSPLLQMIEEKLNLHEVPSKCNREQEIQKPKLDKPDRTSTSSSSSRVDVFTSPSKPKGVQPQMDNLVPLPKNKPRKMAWAMHLV